jgi:hypothetical protein
MSTRPYELLARFGNDGTVSGVHIRTITTVNGKDFEGEPQPLSGATDPAFVAFATQFAAAAVAERDNLKTQLEQASARIAQLLESLPWNPRIMEAKAFVARITASEMLSLASSQDPQVKQIVGMLTAWVATDWPIVLDSPEIQSAIPYLMSVGLVTENRVAELLRDCTQAESYVADGV